MNFFNLSTRKRLLATINNYSNKLASENKINHKDAIACHLAKLILLRKHENRFRSIQTVAQLSPNEALPPALKEIVSLSRSWPNSKISELVCLLALVVHQIMQELKDRTSAP